MSVSGVLGDGGEIFFEYNILDFKRRFEGARISLIVGSRICLFVLEEEEASTDRSDGDYFCETATELSAGYQEEGS
jgi:hypothetical protein